MTTGAAYEYLTRSLLAVYDPREAASVADLVLESRLGLRRMDRILRKTDPLAPGQAAQLEADLAQLLRQRPVQYVLGEAWFDGLLFHVNEDVLIPRPETEELVHWIVEDARSGAPRILDIGTGSGCIPIALQKHLPNAAIHALDVSPGALTIARANAERHHAPVRFIQADFLDKSTWTTLPAVDILVSNPPYIAEKEKAAMHDRVLTQEPHLALFVPDDDALVFYRKLARVTNAGTVLYVEINESLGPQTAALFESEGLNEVTLKKDMQGKDRMIRARR
ncbi:peptide chain release factor N(5)-glutamine methyltransferase [Dinghuibacter silviterrae]|uniref:peptide chain release factor N(5)-glutamine methyltransferase n=1 Tax=Dinghuibacter silviterrae TaxID=1539049 RepID=A0A4R8DEF1_9BACT|nr:peptide chain release factor N(5)-glutamine methyltransferase [Dinghuibacter silviterrae]TDW95757.1 release factor glutamine methyltransferase [Dinghuibacter silviterrae]